MNCSSIGHYGKTEASAYIKNRFLDAGDIFSFTMVFNTYGARVATSSTGLGLQMDGFPAMVMIPTTEVGLRFGVIDSFECRGMTPIITYWEDCHAGNERLAKARNKEVSTEDPNNKNKSVYTRFGIMAGLLIGFKFEFNPGELLDFALGFAGIDLYDDDIIRKDLRPDNLIKFLDATEAQDHSLAIKVIEQGLSINTIDKGFSNEDTHNSLLVHAILTDNIELAKYLIDHEADPNIKNLENENAISLSFKKNQPQLANYIITNSKVKIERDTLSQALLQVIKSNNLKMTESLLKSGADVNYDHGYALYYAVKTKSDAMMDVVLKAKPKLNLQYPHDAVFSSNQISILTHAERVNYLTGFKKLLDAGADPNAQNGYNKSVLMDTAKSCDNLEYVRELLKRGANKNIRYAGGEKRAVDFIEGDPSSENCKVMKEILK